MKLNVKKTIFIYVCAKICYNNVNAYLLGGIRRNWEDTLRMEQQLKTALGLQEPCTIEELYHALNRYVKKQLEQVEHIKQKRKLYYVSAEFLMGKMLSNYLINLGIYDEVEKVVASYGYTMQEVEEQEAEPSLGNGGLGRLAACFLDSIASLSYCGDGIGLYYHFGLFQQVFENYKQKEIKDAWINEQSWVRKTDTTFPIYFGNAGVLSRMYDMDIVGANGGKNTLHLFDIESVDESLVGDGIRFDKRDIERNLTLFLYPDDSDEEGRLLRIYQQYFMVSSGAQLILEEQKAAGHDLHQLARYVCIQINDTHPTLIIPELIRLLMQEGITMKQAIDIVAKTCAYTNHTILAEALETWPRAYLKKVVPQLMDIIEALDAIQQYQNTDEKVAIIDAQDRVHMAHLDIHYGYSINGVAALHTEILKQSELHAFYKLYPEKFNNKTNGISFRRFLSSCNRELLGLIKEYTGKDASADPSCLLDLMKYQDDSILLQKLCDIKQLKKQSFADFMQRTQKQSINPKSIYDVQIKRLHEYKRQQMNALYIIHKYMEIKAGKLPTTPITFIFGAKAAPAYTIAKDIIHVLLCLQEVLASDPDVSPYINICFIENYNVSKAERLIPAADISEQISLASKEASGTGNMKLMVNGAVTIGTMDGANVEIMEAVGEENIYVFGETSEQVIAHYKNADYCARAYYEKDAHIAEIVDFLISDTMCAIGDPVSLQRFYNELLNKDWFMTLLDLNAYIECKETAFQEYTDRIAWAKKMLVNIANSAYFSSDRTIKEYAEEIWKL